MIIHIFQKNKKYYIVNSHVHTSKNFLVYILYINNQLSASTTSRNKLGVQWLLHKIKDKFSFYIITIEEEANYNIINYWLIKEVIL